jgi:membrane fusion protein, multidrug efflux system
MTTVLGENMINKLFVFLISASLFLIGCEEEKISSEETSKNVSNETKINEVPVEAMVIKEKIIEHKIPLTCVLEPYNSIDIISEVSGKVVSVKKELGDFVNTNQTLASIDDVIARSQFKQAEAQVMSSENNLKISKSNLESDKLLFENKDISELEYNNSQLTVKNAEAQYLSAAAALSSAKKYYEDTKIKTPISGFVSRKNIDYGTMVSVGSNIYRIIDISKMKIFVSVPQELINKIHIGGKAKIIVSALNNKSFSGSVKHVSPQADEQTGGFIVEIHVINSDNIIKGGMTAKLELIISNEQNVLTIPGYSIVSKNDEYYIYKIKNNVADLVKINVLESVGENIIIDEGVAVGDTVVTVGMKNLGLETKVKIEELY